MSGYLYIISNINFPGWIKVGVTKDLKSRLQTYQTASPFRNYILEYSIHHPAYLHAEKRIKETLKPFAKSIKNEWYEVDLAMAKPRLDEQLEEYIEKNLTCS
jgi:predicted GIY-YIG superfamily endonuclease